MSPARMRPGAGSQSERAGMVGSRPCVVCGRPRDARKREACSDRCRAALSRQRKTEARQERDAEIRALLEAALEKLRGEP